MPLDPLILSALGPAAERLDYTVAGTKRTGWRLRLPSDPTFATNPAADLVDAHWRALHERGIPFFVGPPVWAIGPGKFLEELEWVEYPIGEGPTDAEVAARPPVFAQVFALPGLPVLDVVEFSKVGSHNTERGSFDDVLDDINQHRANMTPIQREFFGHMAKNADALRAGFDRQAHGTEPWRAVQTALEKVQAIAPFAIQFADEAGLRATLLRRVSTDEASLIAALILDVNIEAMDAAASDLEQLGLPVPTFPDQPDVPDPVTAMTSLIATAGRIRMWWD